jgi:hypothetical protein
MKVIELAIFIQLIKESYFIKRVRITYLFRFHNASHQRESFEVRSRSHTHCCNIFCTGDTKVSSGGHKVGQSTYAIWSTTLCDGRFPSSSNASPSGQITFMTEYLSRYDSPGCVYNSYLADKLAECLLEPLVALKKDLASDNRIDRNDGTVLRYSRRCDILLKAMKAPHTARD